MNWDEYFKLKNKQKRNFWKFFIVLTILNIFFIMGYIAEGPDYVCDRINASCYRDIEENGGLVGFINKTKVGNQTDLNLSDEPNNLTDLSGESSVNKADNEDKHDYMDYVWFSCDFGCSEIPTDVEIKVLLYRLRYSPLFIVTNLVLAFIFAIIINKYSLFKLDLKKVEKEEGKEEKKA